MIRSWNIRRGCKALTYDEAKDEVVALIERYVQTEADCDRRGLVCGLYEDDTMHWHCVGDIGTATTVIVQGLTMMAADQCGPSAVRMIDEACEHLRSMIRERTAGMERGQLN